MKKAYKSKTIWLAGALAALAPVLMVFPEMKAFLGLYYGPALMVLSFTVGALRFVTTQPLEK